MTHVGTDGFGFAERKTSPGEDMRGPVARTWQRMGRGGQATVLGAALFSVIMVMLATAGAAYSGACSGPAVSDIGSLPGPVARAVA